jgi:hypothetical protein
MKEREEEKEHTCGRGRSYDSTNEISRKKMTSETNLSKIKA